MREGDWKLVSMGGPAELYNLRSDIGESKDLSGVEKGRVQSMSAAWEAWEKNNLPPMWTPTPLPGQKKKKKA
jgi:arylsulfatase